MVGSIVGRSSRVPYMGEGTDDDLQEIPRDLDRVRYRTYHGNGCRDVSRTGSPYSNTSGLQLYVLYNISEVNESTYTRDEPTSVCTF